MRIITIALAALLLLFSAIAAGTVIDLNKPGAMEQVRKDRPKHYEKIQSIMEGVIKQPDEKVPEWLKVNYQANNATYAPILMISHPPKKRLSFQLDEIRYEAVVTLTNFKVEVVPTK